MPGTMGKVKARTSPASTSPRSPWSAPRRRPAGQQRRRQGQRYTLARVASIDLGDGALVITGIQGKANVEGTRSGVKADTEGTKFLTATVNGTEYSFPELDGLSIPGLVGIETGVVTKYQDGHRGRGRPADAARRHRCGDRPRSRQAVHRRLGFEVASQPSRKKPAGSTPEGR